MKKSIRIVTFIFFLVGNANAQPKLPGIFGDSMVLQRDVPLRIWGTASPGEKIIVGLHQQKKMTIADRKGNWLLILNPEKAGGPYELSVAGKEKIVLRGILMGDIWFCSGQSNMEMPLKGWGTIDDADEEIRKATHPQIRLYTVPKKVAAMPVDQPDEAGWQVCSPANIPPFSAVAYFFGRRLQQDQKVPVGLINSTWGGTQIESWISHAGLTNDSNFHAAMQNAPVMSMEQLLTIRKKRAEHNSNGIGPNDYPSVLFNGMVHPFGRLNIKGCIWYQGEANAGRAHQYRHALPLLIRDWRKLFGNAQMPFYYVQLTSFIADSGNSNKGSTWAELRESQASTLRVPNTGMAVIIDLGDVNDIHPRNKKDVGERLAALALKNIYHRQVMASGPVYKTSMREGNSIRIGFSSVEAGLAVRQGPALAGFEIAGEDKKFYPAEATISGNEVIVHSDQVTMPVSVRYAWADDVSAANLCNKEGWPAAPFRTDDWPGITIRHKYDPSLK